MADTRLIHIRLDRSLVETLDREAKGSSRSAVIARALEEYLRKKRLLSVIDEGAGSLSPEEARVWGSAESVDSWVRERRREWRRRLSA